MAGKIFQSRVVLAAIITGVFSVIVALIVTSRNRDVLPPLEIRSITNTGETVLATLALRPEQQVIDSLEFKSLDPQFLLLSDTFGIAIQKPEEYQWMAGRLKRPTSIDLSDLPLDAAIALRREEMFEADKMVKPPYYGVQLDHEFELRITAKTEIEGIPFGFNWAKSPTILHYLEKVAYGDKPFDHDAFYESIIKDADSIIQAGLPMTKTLACGVFIIPVTERNMPKYSPPLFSFLPLFDKIIYAIPLSYPPPKLFFVDSKRRIALINESVTLTNVEVDGVNRKELVINNVGYVVESGNTVYAVRLKYLSNQDEKTLAALQRFFKSVRLRSQTN